MGNNNNDGKGIYPGTWHTFSPNFKYKLMRYHYSCFPCSLHTILANLECDCPAAENHIEDTWEAQIISEGSISLSDAPPKVAQLNHYLPYTQHLNNCKYKKWFAQDENFQTLDDAKTAEEEIKQFINGHCPAGMMAGDDHAQVFFHTADGKFLYYNPAPDEKSALCCEIEFTEIKAVTGSHDKNRIMLEFKIKGDTKVNWVIAKYVMLIR